MVCTDRAACRRLPASPRPRLSAIALHRSLARLCACALCALPAMGWAGSLSVVPVRVQIDARDKPTESLRIRNTGDEKITVQLDVKAWTQDAEGADEYAPTEDIVLFPRIADIGAGEERILRLGYRGPRALAGERSYRLFVQELPVTRPGELALRFALRLGIPVFVAPAEVRRGWHIHGVGLAEERLSVTVRNTGNTHAMVQSIELAGSDGAGQPTFSRAVGGWYVLAGARKSFSAAVSAEECLAASQIGVRATVDRDSQEHALAVEPAYCSPRPAGEPADGRRPPG